MSHTSISSLFCCSNADGVLEITATSLNCSYWTLEVHSPLGTIVFSDPTVYANGATAIINDLHVGTYIAIVTETCDGNCQSSEFFAISSACPDCGCTDPDALNYDPTAMWDEEVIVDVMILMQLIIMQQLFVMTVVVYMMWLNLLVFLHIFRI